MKQPLKVGDTIYRYDENHRVYDRNAKGEAKGPPIFSGYFRPYRIVGEEKRSWILAAVYGDGEVSRVQSKLGKHIVDTRPAGYGGAPMWSSEAMREACIWRHTHGYALSEAVRRCVDLEALKEIARLVGYQHG